MASQEAPKHRPSLYPQVDQSNPDSISPFTSNPNSPPPSSLYPYPSLVDPNPNPNPNPNSNVSELTESVPFEETLIAIPGAIVHLIDEERSVELAIGEFSVVRILDGDTVVAVIAGVGDQLQWPLLKNEAAVKLDDSHYFFSLRSPKDSSGSDSEGEKKKDNDYELLNYGLSFVSDGQDEKLEELERVVQSHTAFTVQSVAMKGGGLDGALVVEASPEARCAAYWTTLAPNVEEYGGVAAKMIAAGSGQLIRGILWCGDVAVDRLKWSNEVLMKRMTSCEKVELSPKTLRRIKRVKRVTKTTQKVADGVMSGVVRVSVYFTSSVANTKVGRSFFSNMPGEILLASLDGFNKVCDALEVAGKNVMSTSSTVTTSLVTHKYGEEVGEATKEGLGAAGHAIWTAWTVYKIRKALNPKGVFKKTALVKSAAEAAADEYKAKKESKSK